MRSRGLQSDRASTWWGILSIISNSNDTHQATEVTGDPRWPPASTVASFMRRTSTTATEDATPYASASPGPRMSAASAFACRLFFDSTSAGWKQFRPNCGTLHPQGQMDTLAGLNLPPEKLPSFNLLTLPAGPGRWPRTSTAATAMPLRYRGPTAQLGMIRLLQTPTGPKKFAVGSVLYRRVLGGIQPGRSVGVECRAGYCSAHISERLIVSLDTDRVSESTVRSALRMVMAMAIAVATARAQAAAMREGEITSTPASDIYQQQHMTHQPLMAVDNQAADIIRTDVIRTLVGDLEFAERIRTHV